MHNDEHETLTGWRRTRVPAPFTVQVSFLCLVVLMLLAVGPGCDERTGASPDEPYTRILVYNRSSDYINMGSTRIDSSFSQEAFILHGKTERYVLTRGTLALGTLVVASLIPAGDPDYYDGAVTIYEESPGRLYLLDISPWIDAVLEGAP